MSPKHIFQTIIIAAITATILMAIGIFIIQGFSTPSRGLRYSLVTNMFSDPEWLAFHFKAWTWLFVSGTLSGCVSVKLLRNAANAHNN